MWALKSTKKSNFRAIFISVISSLIITFGLYLAAPAFVAKVDFVLNHFFEIQMGRWYLQHIVFALSFGSVPVISVFTWKWRRNRTTNLLLKYNVFAFLLQWLYILLVFVMVVVKNTGFRAQIGPLYLQQPHLWFWNYIFILSTLAVLATLIGFTSFKNRNALKIDEKVIDNS